MTVVYKEIGDKIEGRIHSKLDKILLNPDWLFTVIKRITDEEDQEHGFVLVQRICETIVDDVRFKSVDASLDS